MMPANPFLFALAIYAAILSTLNFVHARRRERRSITVAVSTQLPAYTDGQTGEPFIQLRATNAGHRPVTVRWLGFELETGECFGSMALNSFPGVSDTPLPATLSDGQSAHIFVSYRAITRGLLHSGRSGATKLIPVCQDSLGEVYKGSALDFDPSDFLR
jgi:hypothetical protein